MQNSSNGGASVKSDGAKENFNLIASELASAADVGRFRAARDMSGALSPCNNAELLS
jgi:hypothetical protein